MGLLDGVDGGDGHDDGANQLSEQALGFSLGKTADLITDLWDKRDAILGALDWVKDHGDDLVRFMHHVPDLLGKVGDAMDGAGKAAHTASQFLGLAGHDDHDGAATVAHLAAMAGGSLDKAHDHIGSVSRVLSDLAGYFDKVPLVGDNLAERANHGSELVSGFSTEIRDIAAHLAHIATRVAVVSEHLVHVGNGLADSSVMLRSLVGGGATAAGGSAPGPSTDDLPSIPSGLPSSG